MPRDEPVLIGVSGGADSVCLLHILANRRRELGIKLHAAHLDHQLRGTESIRDAEYVSNLAGSLGVPLTVGRQNVAAYRAARNCSIEEAARELRYAFLARAAQEVGANRVAVGHTRDDQVETILMHILRGTGTGGLRGLAPCSPIAYDSQGKSSKAKTSSDTRQQQSNLLIVRPLLDVGREETASYCRIHRLAPRIDSSNLSLSFFRNRLRLQLLPLLRQYNPDVDRALLRLADIAAEESALVERQVFGLWDKVTKQWDNSVYLDKKQLAGLPIALQRRLLRAAVTRLVGDARDIEATHIEAARSLLNKPAGKNVSLPHGLVCYAGYDELAITRLPSATASHSSIVGCELPTAGGQEGGRQFQLPPSPFPPLSGEFRLNVPGETSLPGWKATATIVHERPRESHRDLSVCCHPEQSEGSSVQQSRRSKAFCSHLDLRKTGTELFVRPRHAGDRFQPLGMGVPKKLYEFMVDAKIPRSWRDSIPIVCSPQQIIWVLGWRIDDRVKLTAASQEILRLEFVRSE
jgi:tRNA(Ile)-lysidine synthase